MSRHWFSSLFVVLSIFVIGTSTANGQSCDLPQQCQGYPAAWDTVELLKPSYRLVIEGAHDVRRSDNTTIPESSVRADVATAIDTWLTGLSRFPEPTRHRDSKT